MLKFKPNQEINVYKIPNSDIKFKANILTKISKTLIITRPHLKHKKNDIFMENLVPNSTIYGDYEFEGRIYYFRSKIIKSNYTPFPHLIITEPDEKNIKIIPIRKSDRYKTLLPITILFKKDDKIVKFLDAFALDFSRTGIGIISLIEVDEVFNVDCTIFEETVEFKCKRRVFIKNKFLKFHFIGAEILEVDKEKVFHRFLEFLKIINEKINPF